MSRTKKDTKKFRETLSEKLNTFSWGAPSSFKRGQKRSRRAKEKQAFKSGKEDPNFKRSDNYEWF